MIGLKSQTWIRSLVLAIVFGALISLATGLVETWRPEYSIMEYKYYGYPLVWRVTALNGPTEFKMVNLAIDAVFWITISFLALIILEKILKPASSSSEVATRQVQKHAVSFCYVEDSFTSDKRFKVHTVCSVAPSVWRNDINNQTTR